MLGSLVLNSSHGLWSPAESPAPILGVPSPPHRIACNFLFNPGSTLSAMDAQGIGRVATNTTLAACAAGLTSMFYAFRRGQGGGRRPAGERLLPRAGADTPPFYLGSPPRAHPLRGAARGLRATGA